MAAIFTRATPAKPMKGMEKRGDSSTWVGPGQPARTVCDNRVNPSSAAEKLGTAKGSLRRKQSVSKWLKAGHKVPEGGFGKCRAPCIRASIANAQLKDP